jgi:cytoskeletal protein CcmA (bactofilin family)
MENIEPRQDNPGSLIGADVIITGNVESSVDLMIEGKVTGDVRCHSTLLLGENSAIVGNIVAERVRVSGAVEGSIDSKDLAIEASGKVAGDVSYARLKVANGGTVEGNMKCQRNAAEQRLKLVEGERGPRHVVIE